MENTKHEDKDVNADIIRGFWIEAEDDLEVAEKLLAKGGLAWTKKFR